MIIIKFALLSESTHFSSVLTPHFPAKDIFLFISYLSDSYILRLEIPDLFLQPKHKINVRNIILNSYEYLRKEEMGHSNIVVFYESSTTI